MCKLSHKYFVTFILWYIYVTCYSIHLFFTLILKATVCLSTVSLLCTGKLCPFRRQHNKKMHPIFADPPAQKPVIQQQTTGPQFLQIGDNLTCTVTGGKPLVDSVHFYCTNPDLPDKEDARSASSVSSSVTVKTIAGITDTHMTCYCNATWGTKAEYYALASSAVYFFKRRVATFTVMFDWFFVSLLCSVHLRFRFYIWQTKGGNCSKYIRHV